MKKIIIVLLFLFTIVPVTTFADECNNVVSQINETQTQIRNQYTDWQAQISLNGYTKEQQVQLATIKLNDDQAIAAQIEKNTAELDSFMQTKPLNNTYYEGTTYAEWLSTWNTNEQTLVAKEASALQNITNQENIDLQNAEVQFNEINAIYVPDPKLQLQLSYYQQVLNECNTSFATTTIVVSQASPKINPLPVLPQKTIVINKKTIVAKNNEGSIINATTTKIMAQATTTSNEILLQKQPKLNLWQKIIKFFKQIF